MTSIKAVFKKFQDVGLTASKGSSRVEVEIVDVNVATIVSMGVFGFHESRFCEDFRAFSPELKHFTHGRVAINVGISALHVRIFGSVRTSNSFINLHEVAFRNTDIATTFAIVSVSARSALVALVEKRLFDYVLKLFDRGNTLFDFIFCVFYNLIAEFFGGFSIIFAGRNTSFFNCINYFSRLKSTILPSRLTIFLNIEKLPPLKYFLFLFCF